jgi:hypothetical protein
MATRCSDCGAEIDESADASDEQRPCPACGSTRRTHFGSSHLEMKFNAATEGSVQRVLDDLHLAVFSILVGIALSVGFGIEASWLWQVIAGGVTFGISTVLMSRPAVRRLIMTFMRRVTGQ